MTIITNKTKIFLGGTCNNSTWRETLIPLLKVDFYNPVVPNWTPECQAEEIKQRGTADFVLYVITPLMTGVYSIAEVVDDSNKRPAKTIFCILIEDDAGKSFDKVQIKSLNAVKAMVLNNGGKVFDSLSEIANFVNSRLEASIENLDENRDAIKYSTDLSKAGVWVAGGLVDKIAEETPHGECGEYEVSKLFRYKGKVYKVIVQIEWNRHDKQYYYIDGHSVKSIEEVEIK